MRDLMSWIISTPTGLGGFWIWISLGAATLLLEVILGTQWLLWTATAAGVTAVISLTGLPLGPVAQIAIFAGICLILAGFSRRILAQPEVIDSPDINAPLARLTGRTGQVVSGFDMSGPVRVGRVVVDGVEWPAELNQPAEADLNPGATLRVLRVHDGRLVVETAEASKAMPS